MSESNTQIRRMQTLRDGASYTINFPKEYATALKIEKGSYIKYQLLDSKKVLIEKAEI